MKGQKSSSVALVAFIIVLVCIEASLFRLGERRINFPILMAVILLLAPHTLKNIPQTRELPKTVVSFITAYAAYIFISTIWSANRSETIFHSTIFLASILTVFGMIQYNSRNTARIFVFASAIIMLFSWLALFVSPDFALQQKGVWRLRGVMNHEFELGFLAAATLIILAAWWVRPDTVRPNGIFGWPLIAIALFAAITLFATQTRTLMVYTLAVLGFVGIVHSRGSKRALVIMMISLIAVVGFLYLDDILSAFSRGEGDATLSGRTTIWSRSMTLADEVPWLGYGFASFTDQRFDYIWSRYRPPHAHNTWIMAYFETGRIGVFLVTGFIVAQLLLGFGVMMKTRRPSLGFLLCMLVSLSGFTSLIYGGKLSALICLPLLLLLQENAESRRGETQLPSKANVSVAASRPGHANEGKWIFPRL